MIPKIEFYTVLCMFCIFQYVFKLPPYVADQDVLIKSLTLLSVCQRVMQLSHPMLDHLAV